MPSISEHPEMQEAMKKQAKKMTRPKGFRKSKQTSVNQLVEFIWQPPDFEMKAKDKAAIITPATERVQLVGRLRGDGENDVLLNIIPSAENGLPLCGKHIGGMRSQLSLLPEEEYPAHVKYEELKEFLK